MAKPKQPKQPKKANTVTTRIDFYEDGTMTGQPKGTRGMPHTNPPRPGPGGSTGWKSVY